MKTFLIWLVTGIIGWMGVAFHFGIAYICIKLFNLQMDIYHFVFLTFLASYYSKIAIKAMEELD